MMKSKKYENENKGGSLNEKDKKRKNMKFHSKKHDKKEKE